MGRHEAFPKKIMSEVEHRYWDNVLDADYVLPVRIGDPDPN
jgi:hypothetical protein